MNECLKATAKTILDLSESANVPKYQSMQGDLCDKQRAELTCPFLQTDQILDSLSYVQDKLRDLCPFIESNVAAEANFKQSL